MNHPVAQLPEQNLPDYNAMPHEKQAQHYADFVTKFGILRSSWPSMGIPDLNNNMSLREIHAMYNTYVRQIHIHKNVDDYRNYMIALWWILELLGNKAGLSISGYAQSQMNSMSKYERLLIELGENKYKETAAVSGGLVQPSQWPVELRLLGVALMQALIFVIVRTCASYLGAGNEDIKQIISFFSGQSTPSAQAAISAGPTGASDGVIIPDPPTRNQGGLGGMLSTLMPGFLGNILGGGNSGADCGGGGDGGLAGMIGPIVGTMM